MSVSAKPDARGLKTGRLFLRLLQTAAASSMLAILGSWYAAIFSDLRRQDFSSLLWPLVFCPLWLPYAWVVRGLRSDADRQTKKKAVAVALGCGALNLMLFSFLLAVTSFDADKKLGLVFALLALLQIGVVASAATSYYSLGREPGDVQILATRLWIPAAALAVGAIVLPNVLMTDRATDEATAVGSLRTINIAQVEYARLHSDKGQVGIGQTAQSVAADSRLLWGFGTSSRR